MSKYNIEGDINFFDELYKSLDDDVDELNIEEENNLCLISNEILKEKFFRMNCGHKFNYIPLFLDIKNHKQKFNILEGSSSKLTTNQIRCPYCRNKQIGVLPYYEDLGLDKINGVNYIDLNIITHNGSYYKKCEFLTPQSHENDNTENDDTEMIQCQFIGSQIQGDNFGDTKHYCYNHKKQIIKNHKQLLISKAKEEKQNEKNKIKEEKQNQKNIIKEEKQKIKEEKQKVKEEKQKIKKSKINTENIVLGPLIVVTNNDSCILGCEQLLKSGQNKGNPCGCKIFSENLCKIHFKIKQKVIVTN